MMLFNEGAQDFCGFGMTLTNLIYFDLLGVKWLPISDSGKRGLWSFPTLDHLVLRYSVLTSEMVQRCTKDHTLLVRREHQGEKIEAIDL